MAKMSGQGVRRNVGCSKACSLQSMFSILTTYPDRICYRPSVIFMSVVCFSLRESGQGSVPHVFLGNSDGVDPDSLAHSVSSGRGVPTPCTRRRSPLRSIAQSSGGGILCADISHPKFRAPTFYIRISHSWMGEDDVSTSPVRHIRIL